MEENHEKYIKRCFDLAKRGLGAVSPNPLVGCVIVHQNTIIGEGWHQQYGGAHAEVNAIASVTQDNKPKLTESTVYVSLEPCCHTGKTPPCTQLLIQHHVKKVVVSTLDPNPKVAGNGIAQLKAAGIAVVQGILENEGKAFISSFTKNIFQQKPYITLKWAQTKDGFIAKNGEQIAISNNLSNRFVHQIRSEMDGIMVGTNTVLIDNPTLNNRLFYGKSPIPILIDQHGKVPNNSNIRQNNNSIIITTLPDYPTVGDQKIIDFPMNEAHINLILKALYQMNIGKLLIEGGTALLQFFIDQNAFDEIIIIESDRVLGTGVKAPNLGLLPNKMENIGGDCWYFYKK